MSTKNETDGADEKPGAVWLVGAGPGDPGLITVKGLRCIANADVIVHDHLCNPSLLEHARPECAIVYAGKQAGRHAMPQEAINALLADKAREGKRVCRLKGGDPFVFGRGGEEALYLREQGIPFEIVPGISSAVAVPAYAGIPVTHRGLAASVRVVTGHEDPTKESSDLEWDEIAATRGTLVFLMGVRNLEAICERLVAGGRDADTPAALIANGTTPAQQTVSGTLATISGRAQEAGIAPPAVLVVGEVAGLRDELAWFEQRPLFGRRIVVTRARAQASDLAAALADLGADVIEAPTIRVESLGDSPEMREAVRGLSDTDWVVLTSVNGVDALMEAVASEGLDARAFAGVRIAAIGPATADRLRENGLRPDVVPAAYTSEALAAALGEGKDLSGKNCLLPRADIAPPALADALRVKNARVVEVTAYRTQREECLPEALLDALEQAAIDLVTFTSSSTVRNFIELLPEDRRDALLPHVRAASIGPVTSQTLRDAGIKPAVTAEESTIPGLVKAIVQYVQGATQNT